MRSELRNILAGGLVVFAVLGAFATWIILHGTNQRVQANDASIIDSLANSDAHVLINSGRMKLLATCCCVPDVTVEVPLLEPLDVMSCVKKHLINIHCIKPVPNDVKSGDLSEYEPRDGDPRETLRYAVMFNNQMLNHMTTINFGRCFEPSVSHRSVPNKAMQPPAKRVSSLQRDSAAADLNSYTSRC